MKIVVVKGHGSFSEECCCGLINKAQLPGQAIMITSYLLRKNKDVIVNDLQVQKEVEWAEFNIAVFVLSLPSNFEKEYVNLKKAKSAGCYIIAVLNDDFGYSEDIIRRYDEIDVVINPDERELVIDDVINNVENKILEFDFTGVMYRRLNEIINTGVRKAGENLYHLKNSVDVYKTLPLDLYKNAWLLTGKGCPMPCTFCSFQKTKARKRDISEILIDIKYLAQHFKLLDLLDLNMPADVEWTNEFLDKLSEKKFSCQFTTDVRLKDLHNTPMLKKFKKAGFALFLIGVEHVNPKILKSFKKNYSEDYIKDGIKNCKKVGIIPRCSFIIGHHLETHDTVNELRQFLKNMPYFVYNVNPIILYKNTPLYAEFKNKNLILDDSLDAMLKSGYEINYKTEGLEPKEILDYSNELNEGQDTIISKAKFKWLRLRSKIGI